MLVRIDIQLAHAALRRRDAPRKRGADYGIAVSVAHGAGAAVIADNMISGARLGAIVGMEWKKPVAGDLSQDGAERDAQLSVVGNRVR